MTGWFFLTIALAGLAVHLATIGLFLTRRRAFPPAGVIGQPAITLIRPVCGLDTFDGDTLRSSFLQDYPDYEIIFCAPSGQDPAVPLVRRLIATHPSVRARLLVGDSTITGNPKLNNLWKGWQAATNDWICLTDSNLLLPPDYLASLAAAWGGATGLVSCPPVGMWPDGLAGSLECAFLNSNQARLQFASDKLGRGFAQGKTLFWNRAMLNRAGGLPALGRYLAEDVNATRLVRAQGLRVSLPPQPFAQPIGRRSLRQLWDRQLRWSRVRRDGFPLLFAAEIANGAAVPVASLTVACALLDLPPATVAGFLGVWYAGETVLMRRAGWPAGPLDVAVLPLRDMLLPVLWATTFLQRGIEWRGTAMAPPAGEGEQVREEGFAS